MDSLVQYNADSERLFVTDQDGTTEVPPDMHEHIWSNPETYLWVSGHLVDSTMVYYFELR